MILLRERCDAALQTAYAVAERLRDPDEVARTARRALDAAPRELMLPGWQPASQLLGHAGIAMLHTRRARDDDAWAVVSHAHLSAAAVAAASQGPVAAGELILPARLHAARFGGYARLLARSAEVHASFAAHWVTRLTARLTTPGPGLSYLDYDVITGLSGQGRALIPAADDGDERSARALTGLLGALVALTRPMRIHGREVPGWWCDPDRYHVPRDRRAFPRGDFNLGVAHGICGPLALLSLAHRAGHRVPDGAAAIRLLADWVRSKERTDRWGAYWPGRVPYEEETGRAPDDAAATARAGWCYGASGVAWTLHLAGQALDDRALTDHALAAMRAALHRPLPRATAGDPGFCHGRAGILHAGVRMAAETGDPELWDGVDRAAHELTRAFDEHSAFGYRQHLESEHGVHDLDSPGLIDGAAGIALALASYADARRGTHLGDGAWDAAFLMS